MTARTMRAAFLVVLVGIGVGWTAVALGGEPNAGEIMRRNFLVGKVPDSRAEVTMTLVSASGGRRQRSTVSLSKLLPNGVDQKRFIRFLTPAEVKGTATLLIEHSDGEDDMWIYLPALHKVRRLVASNKKDSFVGTDFSYGDVIGHKVEDWTHQLVGSEVVEGADTWVIESVPRTDAVRETSGYGKRKLWIRKDNAVAVKGDFSDTSGSALKELSARDVRPLGSEKGKWQAFRVEMRNRQTGHSTEIEWANMEVGVGLRDEQFTERYLEKED